MPIARQLNESLYELYSPHSDPTMQVLFFHGFAPPGHDSDAHLSTWLSRDGSHIWPQTWLAEVFPGAHILSVSYPLEFPSDDLYIIQADLFSGLLEAGVGQNARCPVILVGHSYGGLVMKKLCLNAGRMIGLMRTRQSTEPKNFLENVKGVFFYSTPHLGFSSEAVTFFLKKSPLQLFVKMLSKEAARLSSEFRKLKQFYDWRIGGVGESLATGRYKGIVVPEQSSRVEGPFAIVTDADHFTVCRPASKESRSFFALRNFVERVQEASSVVSIHQEGGVPEYAAGLEERVHYIQRMLTEVAIVGVVGMAGSGKTAIATLLFNQISREFEYTNFVDVKGILTHRLEYWLLSHFYHQGTKVDSDEMRWSYLQEKKTLIVMDDVDSVEQLLIVGPLSRFGNGSCLIITSRNREVLKVCENYDIYEVPFLREDEATRLLCHHVFGQENIPKKNSDLDQNLERMVHKCQGLPLTIKVIGSYLRGRNHQAFWEQAIDKLANAQAVAGCLNDPLWASLRESYDSLSQTAKQMFMDAATYFYEQPLEQALAAWDSAYGDSHVIWENLLNTSMVKEVQMSSGDILGERETPYAAVWVHAQLRDLARALSRDHVRSGSENVNWLRANAGILHLPTGVQEYVISSDRSQMTLPSGLLDNPESLKYLDLDGVMIEGLLKNFPRKLSLLRWKMRSISELPQIAFEEMEDLAVLELANWKISKKFSQALGNLINLHILYLGQMEGLDHLPTNFCNLSRLHRLELVDLGLLMLPDSFGSLGALEYLALVNVNISALPESFWQLSSLRELVLEGCTQLGSLESLGHLKALRRLTIRNYERLRTLPESFGMLTALEYLSLVNANISALPESFGHLSSLRELVLHGCTQLERFPESLGQMGALRWLSIENADQVKALPDSFGMLSSLKLVTIRNCQKLESLPESFGELSELEVLVLHGCTQLEKLPESVGQLRALQRLTIADADQLEALPESLGMLSSLNHLSLVSVNVLSFPESIGGLFSLQTLTVKDCKKLEFLPRSFQRLHISEKLVVEGCVRLERLSGRVEEPLDLQLTLINANKLAFHDSLPMVPALKHLTLINVGIEEFPGSFEDLSSLVSLTIRSCLELSSLPHSLGRLSSLEGLYIHNCPMLSRLPDSFGNLSSLKELCIYECPVIRDEAAEAVVRAYLENNALTADLHIDWNSVRDASLRTKLKAYRDRNLRLKVVTGKLKAPQEDDRSKEDERHKEEDKPEEQKKAKHESELNRKDTLKVENGMKKEVSMPLTCAKVFLCGFPEVGKTTLRRSLKRCSQEGSWTKLRWERGPNCFPQPRTRGIEIRRIEEKSAGGLNMTLNLWDLAGQHEYHVLHGNFFFFAGQGLAGGKATTFVLVFRDTFKEGGENDLLYWLQFIASGSPVKRHVVIVLNHFGFNFGSIKNDRERWLYFINKYKIHFEKHLHIHPEPFMIDVRVASKVEKLKKHLFKHVGEQLRGVSMPLLCREIQVAMKSLPLGKIDEYHPILTWETFEQGLKLKSKGDQLSNAASYLHEMGDIIYFGKEESKEPRRQADEIFVVTDPEWFCKDVVGKFLLPIEWLEARNRQKRKSPERMSIDEFKSLFAGQLDQGTKPDSVISLLEYLGLCYKIEEKDLIIPALSVEDFDYNSHGWEINNAVDEGTGVKLVMGRCLAFEDNDSIAVPMTLFRRLQVGLAKDKALGGCESSDYRAGKSFSIFKVEHFVVLVQFDETADNPNDDRVDILVKSDFITDSFASHIYYICKVMQKLEDLCVDCCPGVTYDIKVIKPWRASGKDLRMIEREIKALEEIKDLVKEKPDRYSTWRSDPSDRFEWRVQEMTFLSEGEQKELLGLNSVERQKDIEQQDYNDCKQLALDMGLEGSLEELDLFEKQEPPESLNSSERQVSNYEILQAIYSDGNKTRLHIDKRLREVIREIRKKHQLLAKKIQAQDLFAVEQNSVPRFMFLSRKDGFWIKLQEAIGQSTFQLHLLCEANFETGIVHPVKDQEGIEVQVSDEFLLRVEPWVRWSLQVIVMVGKTAGNIYFPGLFSLLPDGLSYPNFVNDRTKLLLNKDKGGKLVADSRGNIGTEEKGTKVGSIAQDVIRDLKDKESPGDFKKKTKLIKVRLNESKEQPSVGPSKQAQGSVLWICFECRDKYGDSVTTVE